MKIAAILFYLSFFSANLISQGNGSTGVVVRYHVTYSKEGKSLIDDECELISGKQSIFYSLKMEAFETNIREAIDKSGETGGIIDLNSANLNQNHNFLPVKILKDFSKNSVLFIEDFDGQTFGYKKENSTYSNWIILPDTVSINHLLCQKAQIKKDSLLITAWFCPDIPIHDGPLSYYGLPGLIVKVENNFGWSFNLLSFSPEAKKTILPETISYTLITESKLLKAKKQQQEGFSNGLTNFDGDINSRAQKRGN